MEIVSTCLYCGCGCKLKYIVENNKIKKVLPVNEEISLGKPCIKGLTINEVYDKNRIKYPCIRENKKKDFEKVSWDYILEYIKDKIENYDSDSIMFVGSGETTNEDNYVLQKFARIVAQTNNLDTCARLCHAPTVHVYKKMFGNPANPGKMDEVYELDLLLIAGTNPFSNYPVLFSRILESKKKGLKIIYVHHVDHEISRWADIKIITYPGTEILVFLCWIKYLIESGNYEYIPGLHSLYESVKGYDINFVSENAGVDKETLKKSIDMIIESKKFGFMHGMGLTQQIEGTENIMALVSLALLKNGKILSLRGKINVQGAGDMLVNPWIEPSMIEYLENKWGCSLPKFRGKSLIEAIFLEPVDFIWISSMNPAMSLPNLNEAHKRFNKMFVVLSHYVYNYTAKFANILLPTPLLIEREGTITNGERRVRYVRKVREVSWDAREEWKIFKELAKLFGKSKYFNYRSPKDIFKEIVNVIPSYKGIDPEEVYSGKDAFADKKMKFKILYPIFIEGVGYKRIKRYEFILTSERFPYHFVTGDLTRQSETLRKLMKEPFLFINPEDAKKIGVKDGDKVIIESKVGREEIKVKITDKVREGVLASCYHFESFLFNKLVPLEFDKETHIPNYKSIPVKVYKK